jgi:hypothetical protein
VLTAETQRTPSSSTVFIKEFLCVLCVSAVKTVFTDGTGQQPYGKAVNSPQRRKDRKVFDCFYNRISLRSLRLCVEDPAYGETLPKHVITPPRHGDIKKIWQTRVYNPDTSP